MNSSLQISPTSDKSMPQISNINSMSWLKQDSSSQSCNVQRTLGKDGEILSAKKTDEDYFSGTKNEKKGKKRKEKKGKSVLSLGDLDDLIHLAQRNEQKIEPLPDSNEISKHESPIVWEKTGLGPKTDTTVADGTVWSAATSSADKLFPNVQSVVIDRAEEDEMLTKAIAESIVTVQLEQFKRLSPEEENRWDALYGDDEDEGGWDNVRRNLPPGAETMRSASDASSYRQSCDDDMNNSNCQYGILKNKQKNLSRYSMEPREIDFSFKTCLDNSTDEEKTVQCLKSVSFNESITIKIRSSDSSDDDESDKVLSQNGREPNIDRFGRVDGCSEKRLFMGKGARMKEQDYIQNKCNLGGGEIIHQNMKSNSQATTITRTQKLVVTTPKCFETLQTQKSIPNLEKPKIEMAITAKNIYRSSVTGEEKSTSNSQATANIKNQIPATTTLQYPANIQSERSISNIEHPETEKAIGVKNAHRSPVTRYEKAEPYSQVTAITKTQKPVTTDLKSTTNVQSQRPFHNNRKPRMANTVKNFHRTLETLKDIKDIGNDVEKIIEAVIKSPAEKQSSELLSLTQNSAIVDSSACCIAASSVQSKSEVPERRKLKPIKSEAQTFKGTENLETLHIAVPDTFNGKQTKGEQINHCKNKLVSSNTKTNNSDNDKQANENKVTSYLDEINSPSWREHIFETRDIKDFQRSVQDQDTLSEDLASTLRILDNITELRDTEEESESEGRCLVPTLVKEDEDTPNFSTSICHYADSIRTLSSAEFGSPARQNLLLAGVSCFDQSCDVQSSITGNSDSRNFQYCNYSIQDSVSFSTVALESQALNNVHSIQPKYIGNGNQIHQNTPMNRLPDLNYNAYSMVPNYLNIANERQMNKKEYAYFMHQRGVQNLSYQNISIPVNSDHCNASNFMERGQNIQPSMSIEDLRPTTNHLMSSFHETASDTRKQFLTTQVPPGFVKKLQLPPGFRKRESTQSNNLVINSSAVTQSVKDFEAENGNCHNRKSVLHRTNNFCEATSGNLARKRPTHLQRRWPNTKVSNTLKANRSNEQKQRNRYRSQTGFEHQDSQSTENRKVPYPILGATQNSQEKWQNVKSDKPKPSRHFKLRRDAIDFRSSNMSKSIPYIANDNSSTQNMTPHSNPQGMKDSFQNSNVNTQLAVPGSSHMANWQSNANFMDPRQVPMNSVPQYQMPMPNPHNLPVDILNDYINVPIHQNAGYPHPTTNIYSPYQMPVYSFPHVLNTEVNYVRNVKSESVQTPRSSLFRMNSPVRIAHLGSSRSEMQQSINGADGYVDYNLRQTPMGQFGSNSNFYEPETVPNMQGSWNLHNNQTRQIFDNDNVGRGRGRLSKNNLS